MNSANHQPVQVPRPSLRELPPTAGLPLSWRDILCPAAKPRLEDGLAGFLQVPDVQVEASGTAGLVITLEYLKSRSSRREVLVPAYTCPLVALAVSRVGLELKLCDNKPDSFDMDESMLSALVTDKTLCVIPTHLGGLPCNLGPVLEISRRSGAYVIEDAAQALGAVWHGQAAGTAGDVGFFSLTVGKGLTIGEGGFLVARDEDIRRGLKDTSRSIAPQRSIEELKRIGLVIGYAAMYMPSALSLVYGDRLRKYLDKGDLVEAVGDRFDPEIPLFKVSTWRKKVASSALRRLPAAIASNAERGRQRAALLNKIPGVTALTESSETSGTWPFLVVLMQSREDRDGALDRLWKSGLGVTRLFIHDLTGYDYLRDIVPRAHVPNAASLAERMLTISNSHWVTDRDFSVIAETLAQ